jgi:hypothetical protein
MDKINILKKLSVLRKQELHSVIGNITSELSKRLIDFVNTQDNNVVDSLNARYSQSVNSDYVKKHHEYIVSNYIQIYLNQELVDEIEKLLSVKTKELRVAVMKPGFGLDWHVDFDDHRRLHCDLNYSSDFIFKIKNQEISLEKEVGTVYKLNTAHTHKVFNHSEFDRYALIGVLYDTI